MSEKKTKPGKRQSKGDLVDLLDNFPQATKIQEGKPEIKIASWNMNNLDRDKADDNEQLIDTVCKIITSEKFDLLALQEIKDLDVLKIMCKILNADGDAQWTSVTSRPAGRGFGKDERFAFLFKKQNIQCSAACLINFNIKAPKIKVTPDVEKFVVNISVLMKAAMKNFIRKPFWGWFQINGVKFSLINVHLKANNSNNTSYTECEAECLKTLDDLVDLGTNVIILGDFNLPPNNQAMDGLRTEYQQGIPLEMNTNYKKNRSYDNIWLKLNANHVTAGTGGVFTGQLDLNEGQDISIADQSEDEGSDIPDDEDEEEGDDENVDEQVDYYGEGDEDENIQHAEEQGNEDIGHVINLISDHRPVYITLSFTGEIEHV